MRTITRIIPVVAVLLVFFGTMMEMSAYISAFKTGGRGEFVVVPAGNPLPFWGVFYAMLVAVLLGIRSVFVEFFDGDDFSKYSLGIKMSFFLSMLLGWLVFTSFWLIALLFAGHGSENGGYWFFIAFVLVYMVTKRITRKILLSKGRT